MIRLGQRVLAVGNTGEGKSEALLHLFAVHTGQRVLVDVGDAYTLGPAARAEGVLECSDPDELDWRYRTIRYVPRRPGDLREADRLYRAIWHRGDVLVLLDEAEDVAPAGRSPDFVRKVVKQGRKRRITHLAATQRPHGVERSIVNQAEHAFVFRLVDPDDLATLSYRLPLSPRALADELSKLPPHGHLFHELGDPAVRAMPPIPAHLLELTRRHVVNPR